MAQLIILPQFKDTRGTLTVMEKSIPFEIKRIFYIHGAEGYSRGGHRHHKTIQALVCVSGTCVISNDNGQEKNDYVLDSNEKCLLLYPEDWHTMHSFSSDAVLLVLASTIYDPNDYIDEPYN